IGDVSGDGVNEIASYSNLHDVGGGVNSIHLFDAELIELDGFPENLAETYNMWTPYATAMGDLDLDGNMEIVVVNGPEIHVFTVTSDGEEPISVVWPNLRHDAAQSAFYHFGAVPKPIFVRGDATGDGLIELVDVIRMAMYIFAGDDHSCEAAIDFDADGGLTLLDVIETAAFLFLGGAAPPAPYPDCGEKPAEETRSCFQFECG
ncbi:MAG: hypothetical protein L0Z55_01645, partial [Planctomycetes bacterium]|nr:hypothetical protein [Planctomycetota bacterium]